MVRATFSEWVEEDGYWEAFVWNTEDQTVPPDMRARVVYQSDGTLMARLRHVTGDGIIHDNHRHFKSIEAAKQEAVAMVYHVLYKKENDITKVLAIKLLKKIKGIARDVFDDDVMVTSTTHNGAFINGHQLIKMLADETGIDEFYEGDL